MGEFFTQLSNKPPIFKLQTLIMTFEDRYKSFCGRFMTFKQEKMNNKNINFSNMTFFGNYEN